MTKSIHPLLLCGGSGTRLWPLSRKSYPKQFVKLTGEESLFQASTRRLSGPDFADPVIVTGSDYRFVVLEQMAAVERVPAAVLIEPEARNTAPAILAGALRLAASDPDGLMLVVPSDHVIPDVEHFRKTVLAAVPAAQAGRFVTFGITPSRAETGYGWLELAEAMDADTVSEPQPLKSFVEKPEQAAAEEMLAGKRHLWNGGIFLFSVRTLIAAFEAHDPTMLAGVQAALEGAEFGSVLYPLGA